MRFDQTSSPELLNDKPRRYRQGLLPVPVADQTHKGQVFVKCMRYEELGA